MAKTDAQRKAEQNRYWRMRKDSDPAKYREYRRKQSLNQYKITLEQYDALLRQQSGVCAICHNPPTDKALCVDHCHDTGVIRGLLCRSCNLMLGNGKNQPLLLEVGASYLRAHSQER